MTNEIILVSYIVDIYTNVVNYFYRIFSNKEDEGGYNPNYVSEPTIKV